MVAVKTSHCIHTYCHPQTDGLVESQIICVARCTKCFKLGSKPGWHYVCRISYPSAINNLSVSEEFYHICITFLFFTCTLTCYWLFNSFEEICITRVATSNSFPRVLKSRWRDHIYCHPKTDCLVVSQLIIATRDTSYFNPESNIT